MSCFRVEDFGFALKMTLLGSIFLHQKNGVMSAKTKGLGNGRFYGGIYFPGRLWTFAVYRGVFHPDFRSAFAWARMSLSSICLLKASNSSGSAFRGTENGSSHRTVTRLKGFGIRKRSQLPAIQALSADTMSGKITAPDNWAIRMRPGLTFPLGPLGPSTT